MNTTYDATAELAALIASSEQRISELKADMAAGLTSAEINAKHNLFLSVWGEMEPSALLADLEVSLVANRRLLAKLA